MYQVIEKGDFGVDWAPVRFTGSLSHLIGKRFETEEEANQAAADYMTDANCNNALTPAEKLNNLECFRMTPEGCFLGVLDGKPWYMTYPKDIMGKLADGTKGVVYQKGDTINDRSFFLVEGPTEVAVRRTPGT